MKSLEALNKTEVIIQPVEDNYQKTQMMMNNEIKIKSESALDNLADNFANKLIIKMIAIEDDEDSHQIKTLLESDTSQPCPQTSKEKYIKIEKDSETIISKDDFNTESAYSKDDIADHEIYLQLAENIKALSLSHEELVARGPDRYQSKYQNNLRPYYVPQYQGLTSTVDVTQPIHMCVGKVIQPSFSDIFIDYAEAPEKTNRHMCGGTFTKDDVDEGYATGSQSSSPYGPLNSPLDAGNPSSPSENGDSLEPISSWYPQSLNYLEEHSIPNLNKYEDYTLTDIILDNNKEEHKEEQHLPPDIYNDLESLREDFPLGNTADKLSENVLQMTSCNYAPCSKLNAPPHIESQTIIPNHICNEPKVTIMPESVSFEMPQNHNRLWHSPTNVANEPILSPNCSFLFDSVQCPTSKYIEIRPKPKKHFPATPRCDHSQSLLKLFSPESKKAAWHKVALIQRHELFFQDADGDTCLHIVVCQQDLAMIYTIVQFYNRYSEPHRINVRNHAGQTALFLASVTNQPAVVAYLLQNGADINVQVYKCHESNSPIHAAASRGDFFCDTLEQLCYAPNAKIDIQNAYGYTPLQCAIQNHGKRMKLDSSNDLVPINSINTVEFLLRAGADPTLKDCRDGKCALHFAAEARDPDMIQVFSEYCPNIRNIINCRTVHDETPLHLAARLKGLPSTHHIKILRRLFEIGADPSLCNKENKKPVHLVDSRSKDVISFLQGKGSSRLQAL